jgi:hypothetical protein
MPGEGFFGHRNSFRRSKGEESFDSEVARKKAERNAGAEVHEQEMEEYKKALREQIEREGIESVNMADFFCTAEYLRGAINKKTMEENKELLGFFGAQLDEYEDEGLMLHALIQEAQPQYFKDAVTVDSALRDRQSQCYAAAQTTLALMAGSEKLRSMPKKLQWYKEHVRVIVEREGKWYALEQPTWDEIVPEGFAGTILTDQYTAVHGFLGESIESEFIEMDGTHKAHVVNTDYETNSKLQPYELNFKSEPVISYEGRVPERPSGRQYSYKEGKNQVVLKKILQKVMKALGVDSVTRKAFILASIISATGVLAVDKGSRDAVTTGLEQMVKRIDHWAHDKEWYENEDEYKKYLESFFNPDGSFEYHQFIQRVGYADFFLQLEYLHGHPATGAGSPSKDAKHTLDDKVKKLGKDVKKN